MLLPVRLKWFLLICLAQIVLINSFERISNGAGFLAVDAHDLYVAKCAKCHGADGKGVEKYKKSGQKDFTDATWQKSRTDAQLTASINNGKGDLMPAWRGKLSADEIKEMVNHIRSFSKKK